MINGMGDNIKKYHDAVKLLFDNDSTELFPNNNEEHTTAIIEEILLHAQKSVKILCTCLNHDVWDNQKVMDAFVNAFCRGVKIEIVTQQKMDKDSKLSKLIRSLRVSIKEETASYLTCNFIVADKKMFRFEEDASKRHALASANCPQVAIVLDEVFERACA